VNFGQHYQNQHGKVELEVISKEAMSNERQVRALAWNKNLLAAAYEPH
jgi:hypothetical protein